MSSPSESYIQMLYLVNEGRLSEAERFIQSNLENGNRPTETLVFLGYVRAALNMRKEALEVLARAKIIGSDSPEFWFNIGVAYIRMGNHDDAKSALSKAKKMDKSLKERVKSVRKDKFPVPIISFPEGSDEIVESFASEKKTPKISKAKIADHYVDVIPGMIRKVQGKILNYAMEKKSGVARGTVVLELEDKYQLVMRYDDTMKGRFPRQGILTTVTIEDGKVPRVIEVSPSVADAIPPLPYTPVPKKYGDVRWPKICCGCASRDWKQLKAINEIWHGELSISHITDWKPELTQDKVVRHLLDVMGIGIPAGSFITKEQAQKVAAWMEKPTSARHTGFRYSMNVNIYMCRNCRAYSKGYKSYMRIEPLPIGQGFPDIGFEFANAAYAEAFHDYNPDGVRVKSEPI